LGCCWRIDAIRHSENTTRRTKGCGIAKIRSPILARRYRLPIEFPMHSHTQVLDCLKWRYSTKKFDPSRKIADEVWHTLEQSLVLCPSSFGLQPWRFIVVKDDAIRQQLLPSSWNQKQVVDASHLVVFTIPTKVDEKWVDRHLSRIVETRGVTSDSLAGLRKIILATLATPGFDAQQWATWQIYIALGAFLTAAAMLGIDACPMEGFVPAKYDEILGLPAAGYQSIVLATAGYRAADDKYAGFPKVRFHPSEVIESR